MPPHPTVPSQEASAEDQGTPPSQGPSRSPHVPAPRVHARCPASRCAWLRQPPAQAHPSTWAPAVPARLTSGTLPRACCSWEDKSATLGRHSRVDPTGLIGPHFAARGRRVFLPFVSPPSSVLPSGAAPAACRSSRAGKRWEGVPADLLSMGIVRQGLLPRHCQGKSPPPNPSWHRGTGQKGGETTLGTPPSPPCQHGICQQLVNPMPGRVRTPQTPTTLHRPSTKLPREPSLARSQTQRAQLFTSLAQASPRHGPGASPQAPPRAAKAAPADPHSPNTATHLRRAALTISSRA